MIEQALSVPNGDVTLAGTLSAPEGDATSVVLCLHGTGPMDRDQNMPGQALTIFSPFAEAFAARGVATYRFDKRGCGASTGDYLSAGHGDLASDAAAAIEALRSRGFQRVILMGHSEGTLIAAELADKADALVLLAPFVTPIRALLISQAESVQRMIDAAPGISGWLQRRSLTLIGGARHVQERLIAKIEASDARVLRHSGQKLAAQSLRELLKIDPADVYRAIRCPSLAIVGGKDIQCPPEDAARIADLAQPFAEVHVLPNLTHLLRLSDEPPGFQDYARQLKEPVDAALVDLVSNWVAAQART